MNRFAARLIPLFFAAAAFGPPALAADTTPPVFTFVPPNVSVNNAPGVCGAIVNPGLATATDPNLLSVTGARTDGGSLIGEYPVGTTFIIWTATDTSGNAATATETVTVTDTEKPVISGASANPSVLWPPNHKMVLVTVAYTATDNCGVASAGLTVSSSEPINGIGDGNTSPDWRVVDAHHVFLRAERAGPNRGRTYTVTISVTDIHGNTSTSNVTVLVPHDQGKR